MESQILTEGHPVHQRDLRTIKDKENVERIQEKIDQEIDHGYVQQIFELQGFREWGRRESFAPYKLLQEKNSSTSLFQRNTTNFDEKSRREGKGCWVYPLEYPLRISKNIWRVHFLSLPDFLPDKWRERLHEKRLCWNLLFTSLRTFWNNRVTNKHKNFKFKGQKPWEVRAAGGILRVLGNEGYLELVPEGI